MPAVTQDGQHGLVHTIEKRRLLNDAGVIGVTFAAVIVFCGLIFLFFRWRTRREIARARHNPPSRAAIRAAQVWKQGPPPYSGHTLDTYPPQQASAQGEAPDTLPPSFDAGYPSKSPAQAGSMPPPYVPGQA